MRIFRSQDATKEQRRGSVDQRRRNSGNRFGAGHARSDLRYPDTQSLHAPESVVMNTCRSLRPLLLSGLIALLACNEWHVASPAPVDAIRSNPERVRVTDIDGHRTVVRQPVIHYDTLTSGSAHSGGELFALPVSRIQRLEVRRTNSGKTGALAGGVVMAGVLTFVANQAALGDALERAFTGGN